MDSNAPVVMRASPHPLDCSRRRGGGTDDRFLSSVNVSRLTDHERRWAALPARRAMPPISEFNVPIGGLPAILHPDILCIHDEISYFAFTALAHKILFKRPLIADVHADYINKTKNS